MASDFLKPRQTVNTKAGQVEEAKKMQKATREAALNDGVEEPPYEFLELIGKGTFGRVYKSKNRETQQVVAVKVIEVDMSDYEAPTEAKDDTIEDFRKETSILRQLKDSKAKNVNVLYEAFAFSSQLWIVSEYCPGGSVHTLMKANPKIGLEEKFIIPIARELGIALQYVHAAGVIHRDIKCANILITEDGRLQLCDFGIAGVLTSDHDKRSTLIGTPNWMPKELIAAMIGMAGETKYSTDIDWWAFGCVMYEMATGMPPYGAVHPTQILQMGLPRLEGGKYSQGLRDIVAFCLPESAEDRPSGDKVMQHHYIASTNERYPTSSLSQLLERFALWEQAGGYRQSLFTAYGAQGPILNEEDSADEDDEWNFSTSNEFERRLSQANINRLSDPFHDEALSPRSDNSKTPTALVAPNQEKSKFQQRMEDMAVQRGGKQLEKIFNLQGSEYEYGAAPESGRRMSDLPLRNLEGDTSTGDRTTVIDLDMADFAPPSIDLGQATLKPNRRTQWYGNFDDEEPEYPPYEDPNQTTRRATRDWKMPLMPAPADNPNRRTQDWTFPKMDASDSSANESNGSESLRKRRRPAAGTLKLPPLDAAENPNRRTQDWTFPKAETYMPENAGARVNEASEAFKAQNNSRMNEFNFGGFPAPDSPNRGSIIDLDLALDVPSNLERTFSATSATGSAFTDITTGNPFDLEDQVEMTKSNNRASMHMKSQSEPAARYTNDEADDRAYGSDGDSQVTTDRTGLPRASSARDLNGQFQRQSPSSLQRKWTSHRNNASQDFPFDTGDSSAPESASSSSPTSNTFEGFDSTIIVENEELPKPPANLALLIEQVRKPPLPPDAFIMSNEADEEKMTAELRRLATDLTKTLDVFITRYAVEGEGPVKRI